MIPGSNLLNLALGALGQQTLDHYRFVSRETNSIGLDVATYAEAVQVTGSFQPVPRNLYQQSGLDLSKNYATFFTSAAISDVKRDVSGDYLSFGGKLYQCLSASDWKGIDGWLSITCIETTPPDNAQIQSGDSCISFALVFG